MAISEVERFLTERINIKDQERALREETDKRVNALVASEYELTDELLVTLNVGKFWRVSDETIWQLVEFAKANEVDPADLLNGYMDAAQDCLQYRLNTRRIGDTDKTSDPKKLRKIGLRWISAQGGAEPASFLNEAHQAFKKAISILQNMPEAETNQDLKLELALNRSLLEHRGELAGYNREEFWEHY